MMRIALFLITLATAHTVSAQKDALTLLTGGKSLQWTAGGSPAGKACKTGDARYTFKAKPAQVVIAKCFSGVWKNSRLSITKWSANGRSGIAFGGTKYVVSTEPSSSAICKGRGHCVRLVSVSDANAKTTRTIYLTR